MAQPAYSKSPFTSTSTSQRDVPNTRHIKYTESAEGSGGVVVRRKKERETVRENQAEAHRFLEQERRTYQHANITETDDERYQTIDQRTRDNRSEYNSVEQNREMRKAAKQQEADSATYNTQQEDQRADNRKQQRKRILKLRNRKLLKYKNKKLFAGSARKRVRTIAASRPIVIVGMSTWFSVGLFFWAMSLVGLGAGVIGETLFEWVPIFGDKLGSLASTPGMFIFGVSWFIVIAVGWVTLLGAMIIYSFRRVDWMKPLPLGVLLFCFPLYAGPIINVVPWFLFFVLAVVWSNR